MFFKAFTRFIKKSYNIFKIIITISKYIAKIAPLSFKKLWPTKNVINTWWVKNKFELKFPKYIKGFKENNLDKYPFDIEKIKIQKIIGTIYKYDHEISICLFGNFITYKIISNEKNSNTVKTILLYLKLNLSLINKYKLHKTAPIVNSNILGIGHI